MTGNNQEYNHERENGERYAAELDQAAELLTAAHPLGRVKALGRLEVVAALREILAERQLNGENADIECCVSTVILVEL